MRQATLVLQDGLTFQGGAFGAPVTAIGEVVFNTSHTGYQEILTDPSYADQLLTLTCAEIGNVGANAEDEESTRPQAAGLVVRHSAEQPSNYRAAETLQAYLSRYDLPAIQGIDTRRLVRHLTAHGVQMGILDATGASPAALREKVKGVKGMAGRDLATRLSCTKPYAWQGPGLGAEAGRHEAGRHIVAYDYGLKRRMVDLLAEQGCRVTVVPAATPAAEVLALRPNGVFLTNGPGDPDAVTGAREAVRGLVGKVPVFGICLGHQILALAMGGRTYKLKFGHRGANQPVKELATGKIDITSQNHGFAVEANSLHGKAQITHLNLNDGTVEGLRVLGLPASAPAFSVQYHPEASPGPHDARRLFREFLATM